MSQRSEKRNGWWRIFVPGAGLPTTISERLPNRTERDGRAIDPLGSRVDSVLAEDPALWTEDDREVVRTAHVRISNDFRGDSAARVLPQDRLHKMYRQLLRWLIAPVVFFAALHIWGHLLPSLVTGVLRALNELVLAGIAAALLVISRNFRYHELATAAAVASNESDGIRRPAEDGPRRLVSDPESVVQDVRPKLRIVGKVDPGA